MAKKDKNQDQNETNAADALEAKVDAMMDPRAPVTPAPAADSTPVPTEPALPTPTTDDLPPLDIFSGDKGAPALPRELMKDLEDPKAAKASKAAKKSAKVTNTTEQTPTAAETPVNPTTTAAAAADSEPVEEQPTAEHTDKVDKGGSPDAHLPTAGNEETVEDQSSELDDAVSDKAIDDIVAQESDLALAAEDAALAHANQNAPELERQTKRGHPLFWFLVLLIVIVAIIAAVVLINPNLHNPLTGLTWQSLKDKL